MTLEELVAQCKGEVHVTFNPHTVDYCTVEEYLRGICDDDRDYGPNHENIPAETRDAMVEANRIVEVQWYPDTPIGFCRVYGPSLEHCLARIEKEGIR